MDGSASDICANPFVVKNKWTFMNYVKIIFMAIFVGVLRFALIVIFSIIFVIVTNVLHFVKEYIHKPVNYNNVKNRYLYLPKKILRLLALFTGLWRINRVDESNHDDHTHPSIFIVVPHSSLFDLLAITFLDMPAFVARHQTSTSFLIGKFVKLANPILVKREDPQSRQRAVAEISERARNRETILILPEGTCSNRQMMLRFKHGAFSPGLPIQPIFLRYETDDSIDNLSWTWDGPTSLGVIFLSLCKLYTSLTIIKHPVISPTAEEQGNANLFAENVHKLVCRHSHIRPAYYSFDDVAFLLFAKNDNIPRTAVCLKFVNLAFKMLSAYFGEQDNLPRDTPYQKIALWYIRRELTANRVPKANSLHNQLKHGKSIGDMTAIHYALIALVIKAKENLEAAGRREVDGANDIKQFLGISDGLVSSSAVEDFIFVFGQQFSFQVTTSHLLVIVTLCDPRTPLWDRVRECFRILAGHDRDPQLTVGTFKLLVFYLLGLESSAIPKSALPRPTDRITFANLVKMFKRAVKENADSLRKTCQVDLCDPQLDRMLALPAE